DNRRVSNWADHEEWRYFSYTGSISGGSSLGTNFLVFLNGPGDLYIDDIVLVTGTVANAGVNLLVDGDFESDFNSAWAALGNHGSSGVSTDFSHSGTSSMHLISTGVGGPA